MLVSSENRPVADHDTRTSIQNVNGSTGFPTDPSNSSSRSSPKSKSVQTTDLRSFSSTSSSPAKFRGIKYKGRPPITEVGELMELCEEFLLTKNVTGLSMIARQRGLPPSLRHKIWPVLLKYHPYVLDPYVQPDDDGEDDELKIPVAQIKADLHKYLKNAERYKPKTMSPELTDLFEIQDKIFETLEHSIVKFLKKWGSIVHYNSGLAWIALGLAEWIPPLADSQIVLCGKDDVAKNGTKLRNVNETYFEKMEHESGSVSVSSTLSSTPVVSSSPRSVSSLESTNAQLSGMSYPFKAMTFAEIYERMVLVILHTPDPLSRPESKSSDDQHDESSDDLPKMGGCIEDRISFFLYCLRQLLPELHRFLSEEDLLKGDWILWWLKYCSSKVWSRYDRGRVWDLLLGFRSTYNEKDMPQLEQLTEEQKRLLGPDLFWNPLSEPEVNSKKHRSSSIKTLINQVSLSFDKTPTLASLSLRDDDVEDMPLSESTLPFSQIDAHVQLIFISLAFLKAKEFTIMELDQSEIKQLLNNLSSLKTSEIRSLVGGDGQTTSATVLADKCQCSVCTGSANSTSSCLSSHNFQVKKSNRDIENIILEAGELWRKFIYLEMVEDR
ncbi:hypothetical protein OGAPHI_002667 [Ogataea philodendri]|uniref:Rab-GAP TBC domain-containing protein n=1 Tax=Ogataea philodendri TaxID=1378263 RepID=A0A9P8PBF2_9ASCO|nr:uncharacterized protein OGAPHI_002667 [Ogataea philodendri]KAH3668912.1 hypothetical protein OGAPHI_002667 [Ogataea philodendri]